MRLSEAIIDFEKWRQFKVKDSTNRGYVREIKNFCLFLRNPNLDEVGANDVMDYLNGMKDLGWEHNSFIGKCMALKKFFQYWEMRGEKVLNSELVPIPRKEYKLPRVATDEAFDQLMRAIPIKTNDPRHIRNRSIVSMLWDTGARNGEVLNLDVNDVDLIKKKALIKTEKSRGARPIREIFWTTGTNDNLKRWIDKREYLKSVMKVFDENALYLSICSGAAADTAGRRLTIKGVGEMLRRYSNKAGIEHVNAHSFRHHMGHSIVNKGGSAADVMNILGHASLASSTIYTMMSDKELEGRYRLFNGN